MICSGSLKLHCVSDYNVTLRQALCPACGKKVKITIPDLAEHGNRAKFPKHARKI